MNQTKTPIVCAIILFFCLPISLFAQNEKYSQVKIYPPKDKKERARLIGLLQIDHFLPTQDGAIVSEISQKDLAKLKTTSYNYQVLVPDVAQKVDSLNQIFSQQLIIQGRSALEQPGATVNSIIVTPSAFQIKSIPNQGGYYNSAEIVAAIGQLFDDYPGIVDTFSLGKTVNNRDIWCVKISDNPLSDEANEPELLYMGLQHPREAITGASMIFFMQYLAERYGLDTRIKNLVDNREIYIVPCFNPDGWDRNITGYTTGSVGWRKNRRNNGDGTFGVDLNRNWGVDWSNCNPPINGDPLACGSGSTSAETYWGTAAFSENETSAVRNFTLQHHIVAGFDQHAYGPYYSLPFGRQALHTMSTKGQQFYTAIPALMGKYNGMRAADSYDALGYEVAGGFKDWMLMGELGSSIGSGLKDTVWAMTGEGAAGGGTPAFGSYANFWAPASEIVNLSKSMCFQNLQLAYAAGTYVDIQDAGDIALTGYTGNFNFTLKRLGLGNDPVTVTLVPLENITAVGSPVVINSMNYYDTYNGTVSYTINGSLASGGRVKFAWKVDGGGYSYSDTVVKFLTPTQLLYDDMQGTFAGNWNNTAPNNSASGFGYNYSNGNFVFTASGGYNSTKALSESAAGTNYSTKSLRIAEYKSTLNLSSATASYLTFWVKHKSENFRDKMQVQVSTNGSSWTAIAGKTTVQEAGTLDNSTINGQPALTGIKDYWTQEVFNLSAYNGTTTLYLRFVFTSDDDPSSFAYELDEGFFIDNVKVIKTTAPLVILPVKFLDFTGKLLPDNTVKLNWDAVTDREHDHFVVEKSLDGRNFAAIGIVQQNATYQMMDLNAVIGNNYYRIKQVDKNGAASFSKIINIIVESKPFFTVYPNPVSDLLSISINNKKKDQLTIELTDMQGRSVFNKTILADEQAVEIKVNMQAWTSQVYILKITNSKGELIRTEKIMKL